MKLKERGRRHYKRLTSAAECHPFIVCDEKPKELVAVKTENNKSELILIRSFHEILIHPKYTAALYDYTLKSVIEINICNNKWQYLVTMQ